MVSSRPTREPPNQPHQPNVAPKPGHLTETIFDYMSNIPFRIVIVTRPHRITENAPHARARVSIISGGDQATIIYTHRV